MRSSSSKSSLFLMELILAILIFAASSAVCVQLFAKAHLMSRDTTAQNRAAEAAEAAAACLQARDGDLSGAAELIDGAAVSGSELTVYYGADWQVLGSSSGAAYEMKLTSGADETVSVTVTRLSDSEPLTQLPVRVHKPNTI